MTPSSVHPAGDVLDRYVGAALAATPDPSVVALAAIDEADAVRVELHLTTCPVCRSAVDVRARRQATPRLDQGWWAIEAALVAPPLPRLERVLRWAQMPADVARLLVSTPALRRGWYVAMTVALVFGISAADPTRPDANELFFLILAPLIPLAGVALAYGRGADPAYEVAAATPIWGLRLVLVRAVAVVGTSVAAIALAALLSPAVGDHAAAWLLPALGLSAASLALMTWWPPRRSAWVVASVWVAGVVVANGATDDRYAAFGLAAQLGYLVLLLVASAVVAVRSRRFSTGWVA